MYLRNERPHSIYIYIYIYISLFLYPIDAEEEVMRVGRGGLSNHVCVMWNCFVMFVVSQARYPNPKNEESTFSLYIYITSNVYGQSKYIYILKQNKKKRCNDYKKDYNIYSLIWTIIFVCFISTIL